MPFWEAGPSRTVKGGTGSGDVNSRENRSIYEGLKKAGAVLTSEDWIADYEARYTRARLAWRDRVLTAAERVENPFDAYAANPFCMPHGRPITGGDLKGAKAVLYVLSRISGEGRDRRLEKGDYDLSDREWADLRTLDESGLPVILLVNAGGPVELTDLLEKMRHLAAVLQLSQLGQQGGLAAADVLFGTVVPEGKLTATWPRRYDDLPCARQFGSLNGDVSQDTYREGIYVGYRYFDTFGVRPLFAFGYGLSYTSFDLQMRALRAEGAGICVDVQVTNTGSRFSGREVVQVYLSCPQNGQPRERRRLAGFSKTRLLHPGEGQTVAIHIPQKQLALFPAGTERVGGGPGPLRRLDREQQRQGVPVRFAASGADGRPRAHAPDLPGGGVLRGAGAGPPGAARMGRTFAPGTQSRAARVPVCAGSTGSARAAEAPAGGRTRGSAGAAPFWQRYTGGQYAGGHPAPGSPGRRARPAGRWRKPAACRAW